MNVGYAFEKFDSKQKELNLEVSKKLGAKLFGLKLNP